VGPVSPGVPPTLVTGATGTVGHAIVRELLRRGRAVRALVRSRERARTCLPPAVELVEGDVTDAAAVRRAMDGCRSAHHASGLPEQWLPDAALFTRVNVDGTRHMIDAALAAGVASFVYTSTVDVFVIEPGVEFDESRIDQRPKPTAYERSKQEADRLVTAALDRGLAARFIHPSGVYGLAPVTTGVNDLVKRLVRGEIPMLLPGGFPLVFADDVARGHVLAEERAAVGARFILSDAYRTLAEIARAVVAAAGRGAVPRVMPMWVARAVSAIGERVASITGRPPLIPAGQLQFLALDVRPSARRAERELGWTPLAFDEGLRRTIADLRERREI
jgi:dihydroflavonol-4-reductase